MCLVVYLSGEGGIRTQSAGTGMDHACHYEFNNRAMNLYKALLSLSVLVLNLLVYGLLRDLFMGACLGFNHLKLGGQEHEPILDYL